MNEQEKKNHDAFAENENSNTDTDNFLDLGSDPNPEFDPFADEEELGAVIPGDKTPVSEVNPETKAKPAAKTEPKPATKPEQKKSAAVAANPMEAAMTDAENADVESAKRSLSEKAPVFEYAGATESIEDTSKTFEELRIDKAVDFIELEDGKRVSWNVEYGKVTRIVQKPKETTIAKIKEEIEASKEFAEALKKAKDKEPVCKLKPRVTAQSKGKLPAYKGVFTTLDEAEASGKVISIVPARDGKIYEIRCTEMGRFIAPAGYCDALSEIRAGFTPALPPVPAEMLWKIISFFRYFMSRGSEMEALVNIYWDKENNEYLIDAPYQTVTGVSVDTELSEDLTGERYIHVMDIHSHNSMDAFFSSRDNEDEKATRLYAVVGRLDRYIPDIKVRMCCGGNHHNLEPQLVFGDFDLNFPQDWLDNVQFRKAHISELLLSVKENDTEPEEDKGDDE